VPIFEYRCHTCGAAFESLHARADEPAPECPQCEGRDVARQYSVFAVAAPRTSEPVGPCGSADCACRRP